MKKKKRATVETEKIEEKNTAQERSRVSIRVGQRTIISLIVAVSVAVIAYAALWIRRVREILTDTHRSVQNTLPI